MVWVALGLTLGLIALHMIKPRFVKRRLSSARFFADLPPARKGSPRLRFSSPVGSRPLYLQLPLMLLLCAALWFALERSNDTEQLGFGVWLAVDTSASMTTKDGGEDRMALAVEEARRAVDEARSKSGGRPVCFRLSSFDLDLTMRAEAVESDAVRRALGELEARPLGTDLNLIRALRASLSNQEQGECTITHLVVVSDQPAPDWVAEDSPVETIWRGVGQPVANVGITNISADRDPLSDEIRQVDLTVTAFGPTPGLRELRVTNPRGETIVQQSLTWTSEGLWLGSFVPLENGRYTIDILGDDAYAFDDRAVISVGLGQVIAVDWQLSDTSLMDDLGWEHNPARARLRITQSTELVADGLPTLIVGSGFGGQSNPVRDFFERSPLLRDVNLDAVENVGFAPAPLPEDFRAVLRLESGAVPVAERDLPAAVIVPALPMAGEENQARLATTLFFNGVQHLLGVQEPAPLYELTSPSDPQPKATRLALHPGEGNSMRRGRPFGRIDAIKPAPIRGRGKPVWPMFLAGVALFFAVERLMGAFGGPRWR